MSGQLTEAEIRRVVRRIVAVARPEQVVLFGSYAKGRATARSDLDVLVVVADGQRPRPSDIVPYVAGSVIPVDVHIVTAEEFAEYGNEPYHFLQSVRRSGRTMYRRDDGQRSQGVTVVDKGGHVAGDHH
jgi:predicted nucleotidyltransferase